MPTKDVPFLSFFDTPCIKVSRPHGSGLGVHPIRAGLSIFTRAKWNSKDLKRSEIERLACASRATLASELEMVPRFVNRKRPYRLFIPGAPHVSHTQPAISGER